LRLLRRLAQVQINRIACAPFCLPRNRPSLKAAQLWKFAPAKLDGRNVPSDWLLRFEIDPAAINIHRRK
jgi:hypothetical protein